MLKKRAQREIPNLYKGSSRQVQLPDVDMKKLNNGKISIWFPSEMVERGLKRVPLQHELLQCSPLSKTRIRTNCFSPCLRTFSCVSIPSSVGSVERRLFLRSSLSNLVSLPINDGKLSRPAFDMSKCVAWRQN